MAVFYKNTCCYVALLTMLLSAASPAFAQQGKGISLQELTDAAKKHLPVIAQKQALVNSANAQTRFVRNSFLPSATVMDELAVSTDNSLPGSYLAYGIIPSTSSGVTASNNYQPASGNIGILYSQYDLADFGYKKAAIHNAEAGTNVSKADLAQQQYQLAWQTGQLYFELMKNLYQLEVDRQNVQRYTDIYKVIQAVTLSGIKPGADSSLALAELSKTRILYNQTAGRVQQLQQQLSYLTGFPAADITMDTTGINGKGREELKINEAGNKLSKLQVPPLGPKDSLGSGGGGMDGGMDSSNPLMDYYQQQKQLLLSTETLVKKSYLPRIILMGTAWGRGSSIDYTGDYKGLQTGLGYQRLNYLAGVTLEYDLFNPLHKRDKLAVTHYETIASDAALNQQKQSLLKISNNADAAINTAFKNLQEVPIQINASHDTYNQKVAQYKAGIINLIDLTNASFVLYRAQTDYVQTLSDWFMANLDKAAANGSLDNFIQTVK
jgi:outer membrane protein TolC